MAELMLEEYCADSIQVLGGLEAVRKRPGMYIGDTQDGSDLHHMVFGVLDNAIDEAVLDIATKSRTRSRRLFRQRRRQRRGMPAGIPGKKDAPPPKSSWPYYAGGKFDNNSYKFSGGLHGVGVSVVNALSDWVTLTIYRDGREHFVRFVRGETEEPLNVVGDSDKKARPCASSPVRRPSATSNTASTSCQTHPRTFVLEQRRGHRIDRRARRQAKASLFGGVAGFVQYMNCKNRPCTKKIFFVRRERRHERRMRNAMERQLSGKRAVLTSTVPHRDGVTLTAFRKWWRAPSSATSKLTKCKSQCGNRRRRYARGVWPAFVRQTASIRNFELVTRGRLVFEAAIRSSSASRRPAWRHLRKHCDKSSWRYSRCRPSWRRENP